MSLQKKNQQNTVEDSNQRGMKKLQDRQKTTNKMSRVSLALSLITSNQNE